MSEAGRIEGSCVISNNYLTYSVSIHLNIHQLTLESGNPPLVGVYSQLVWGFLLLEIL